MLFLIQLFYCKIFINYNVKYFLKGFRYIKRIVNTLNYSKFIIVTFLEVNNLQNFRESFQK